MVKGSLNSNGESSKPSAIRVQVSGVVANRLGATAAQQRTGIVLVIAIVVLTAPGCWVSSSIEQSLRKSAEFELMVLRDTATQGPRSWIEQQLGIAKTAAGGKVVPPVLAELHALAAGYDERRDKLLHAPEQRAARRGGVWRSVDPRACALVESQRTRSSSYGARLRRCCGF